MTMQQETLNESVATYDVIVIGGGPAGTTIASLLVEKGWSVCLLEKAHHPRFHIGESLLPMNMPILEKLGVLEKVADIGIKKYAAEFNSEVTAPEQDVFYFAKAVNKNHPFAYQVRRSEFDEILFKNCQRQGVCRPLKASPSIKLILSNRSKKCGPAPKPAKR